MAAFVADIMVVGLAADIKKPYIFYSYVMYLV